VKYLIAGLGNTGEEYSHTRHNIGFDVLDHLAGLHQAEFKTDRLASSADFRLKGRSVFLIKPTTFMNLSGKAIQYWMQKLSIPKEHVLVVTDDLALPLGKIRIRPSGSDGGHNGLKSINLHLQTTDYPRLRFGIGSSFPKGRQVDFVLGKWEAEESAAVKEQIEKASQAIEAFVLSGIAIAMNQFNR
jgi:peptidyl-tRNA hydrolase, PTH1 family